MYLIAAVLFSVAPLCFGLLRELGPRHTSDGLWMAIVASVFAAGVLASLIGRRRTRRAAVSQSLGILVICTLAAGATGFIAGATAGAGIWAVSFVMALCLAASSIFIALARETPPDDL
ncbi:MAG: hypothetical protein ABIZ36_02275 [Gemmatimonadaceae bacterium]